MKNYTTLSPEEIAACSARKPGCDHLYVTNGTETDVCFTQKMIEDYLTKLSLENHNYVINIPENNDLTPFHIEYAQPKIEPLLSPISARKINNWKNVSRQQKIDYFMQNSEFKILSDTSVSGVNYVAALRPGKESPFFSVQSGLFQKPVRNILIKICIHMSGKQFLHDFRDEDCIHPFETMSREDITQEVKIQDDIFRKSYIENIMDPICPAILYTQTDIHNDNLQQKYHKWMISSIIERNPNEKPDRDHHITNYFFNNHFLSIIFMEFSEGYHTLFDLCTQLSNQGPKEFLVLQNILFNAMYELYQLYHKYGIVHGDIHFGNILVNPSYTSGKVLFIDFRNSFYETPDTNKREYDTIIYHQNTNDFENVLQGISNKNDFFQKNFQETKYLRKKTQPNFLDLFFQGSMERWREWTKDNIHYPSNDYQLGGLLQNKRKIIMTKESKEFLFNRKKMIENRKNNIWEFDPRHHLPETTFRITQEMADKYLADMIEKRIRLEQNPPPKVEPASPEKIAEVKQIISDALNRPLEIEHFRNPYIYPIGNPKKIAPIILPPLERNFSKEKQEKVEKNRRTRAKRNTF